MNTIVSAFINLNKFRDPEFYKEHGLKLLELPCPKIIFMDTSLIHTFKSFENEITKIIPITFDEIYLSKYNLTNSTNSTNHAKDTIEYFMIQCNKTEWVRQAIELNLYQSSNYIWIDFGIHHVFHKPVNFNFSKEYSKIRIPSIWDTSIVYGADIYKDVHWYFAGGVFGGDSKMLIQFADLMKEKCESLVNEGKLMWEVNIWYLIWKEHPDLFDIYKINNHDHTMINNY